jgi:hypothetical protein
MTTFGHILEAGIIIALIVAIIASAADLREAFSMATGDEDQADDRDEWAETDRAYQRWIDGQFGL